MWLFVGLGNPGDKYSKNRHNVGFMAVDAVKNVNVSSFPDFRSKFQGYISEGRVGNARAVLLKPMTYMNNSGLSVVQAARFYKINNDKIVVFHDELDIKSGEVRVKLGGGNAGHNGLKSIQAHLGGADFWRVRIGIGRPPYEGDVSNYVLGDLSGNEKDTISPVVDFMGSKVSVIIEENPKAYEKIIKDQFNS